MQLTLVAVLALISGTFLFQQDDYTLELQRMELDRHSEEYVKDFKLFTYKHNRTAPVANTTFTFTKNFNSDLHVIVQAYKFMSNEYRYFPLRFQFDFCKTAARNDFGLGGFYTCGNFTRCPVKKGRYHICNWAPDGSRFPPRIPDGSYKVELEVQFHSAEVMVLSLYGKVYRPIPY